MRVEVMNSEILKYTASSVFLDIKFPINPLWIKTAKSATNRTVIPEQIAQ